MKNGSNKSFYIEVLETKREKYFQILSLLSSIFQHWCSARAGKQQFQWRKESLISCQRNANDNSSKEKMKSDLRLSVWSRLLLSTEKNYLNWFIKNSKCSNMSWLQFISTKRAGYKIYKTKRSSTEWFISSIILWDKNCLHVCAHTSQKGGKIICTSLKCC